MGNQFIERAIELSKLSVAQGGYPVGAVVVSDGEIIGEGISVGKDECDATAHAEIAAIRNASKNLNVRNLENAEVYASMEPCVMCCMACYWSYIQKIYFAVGKDALDKMHFEGTFDNATLISKMNRSLEYTHAKEYESDALEVVRNWEESLK